MLATIPSATVLGVDGRPVTVEVHVANGLPGFNIVGLADAACRESRDRVRAALMSSGQPWPNRRVTVNLAPTGVRKGGPGLDLPIAIGLLVASGALDASAVAGMAFVGELGLDGALRRVAGVVPMAAAIEAPRLVVPATCGSEAALVGGHEVLAASTLGELLGCLRCVADWPPLDPPEPSSRRVVPDLADVRGQPVGRIAVEVAAAGGHHLLLAGPPGSGKTMLAARLPGLLPDLGRSESLEVMRVHSAAGLDLGRGLPAQPPFRAPHHGASAVSLVGGGTAAMRPGEISLAHTGVLFLDELGEFPACVLDSLRQPLEEGVVRVSRARGTVAFPARFLLVAATNPCPCGGPPASGPPSAFASASSGACRCTPAARARYARRLSGPLLDRFDLRVLVSRPDPASITAGPPGETTAEVAGRVAATRERARARGVRANAEIPAAKLDDLAPLTPAAVALLEHKMRSGTLSGRGLHRIRRVARTLADLAELSGVSGTKADGGRVSEEHVCLALGLRAQVEWAEAAA